jgi:hypothetical protein
MTPMPTGRRPMRWQLTTGQWDVLTEALFPGHSGVEVYPSPIEVRLQGRTDVERGRSRAEVGAELRRLGLLQNGQVEPDLAAAMRLLQRPATWVDSVWRPHPSVSQPVVVIAARAGAVGVCAQQHPEQPGTTVLEVVPAAGLAAVVVSRLPAHPPGRSPAVTVALESGQSRSDPRRVLVTASAARTDAERAASAASAILERPHARAGQLAANARDSSGRVRRSEILRWCDNPDGRYEAVVRRQAGGPDWLTVSPADPQRLGEGVQRLLASVHAR